MKHISIILLLLVLCTINLWGCTESSSSMVSINGETMGTTYSVKYINVAGQKKGLTPAQVKTKIDTRLVEINQLMSTYIQNSELSQLNRHPANHAFAISPATEYVLQEALSLYALSNGMLDVTVGPLVNLWGFGPTYRANNIPSAEQLELAMRHVGIDKFILNPGSVTKFHPNVYIDLSTIAKGYGVDEIAELLGTLGYANYLVEIGGEMRVAGTKPNNENWLIAIEKPVSNERSIQRVISIGNNAIATSGDYRNYFEENGIRYSHLINPKTGYPIQHKLVAVTVVAELSIHADGLATALMVLGTEPAMALAEDEGIAALFITKEGDAFVEYQTSAFTQKVTTIEQKKSS